MHCGDCGAQILDGSKFCGDCGAKVDAKVPASVQHAILTTPGSEATPKSVHGAAGSLQGWFWLGGILGVICVRIFFLDEIEGLGWRIFWEELANGRILEPATVLRSSTFAKSVAGFLVGGSVVWTVRKFMTSNAH